jgi:hypothetical protein
MAIQTFPDGSQMDTTTGQVVRGPNSAPENFTNPNHPVANPTIVSNPITPAPVTPTPTPVVQPVPQVNAASAGKDGQLVQATGQPSGLVSNMPVMDIPFKSGLSTEQKTSIYALADSGRALNETDAKNYAFAIGNSNWQQYVGKGGMQLRVNTTPSGGTPITGYTPANQYQFKNPGIATANPGVVAHSNYINALYQEMYNRPATQAELNKFKGYTVKDAANLILGQDKSPFATVSNNGGAGAGNGDAGTGTTFTTGNTGMDELLKQMIADHEKQLAAGKILNPNIPIDPSILKPYFDNAEKELGAYYSEMLAASREDINKSVENLQKAYEMDKESKLADFKNTLGTQRETAAGQGLAFSGGRAQGEQTLQSSSNRALSLSALNQQSKLGDIYRTGEAKIGTRSIQDLVKPIESYSLSTGGAGTLSSQGGSTSYFNPLGSTGSLERERLSNLEKAKQAAELKYRQGQYYNILNQ